MKHKHEFIAVPITGRNVWNGKEDLLGYNFTCKHCHRQAKQGDTITKVIKSHWGEVIPKTKVINYQLTQ